MLRETREASCLRVLRMAMRTTMMTMVKRMPSTGQKYIEGII